MRWLIRVSRSAGCCPSPFSWVVRPYLPMWEAYGVTELQAHALHTSRYSAHSCWAYPTFFSPGERIARIHREARLRAKTTHAPLPCSWEVKSTVREHVVQWLYFGLTILRWGRENRNECCIASCCHAEKNNSFFFSVVSNAFAHKWIIKYLNKTTTPYNIVFRQPPHPSFFSPWIYINKLL